MRALMMSLGLALTAASTLPATNFEMEGGDFRRSNAVTATVMVEPLDQLWESQTCLGDPNTNPLILNGHVVLHDLYKVISLNLGTGAQDWVWMCTALGEFENSPSYDYDRGLLYQGSNTGAVVALRLSDGQPQWTINDGWAQDGGSYCATSYVNGNIIYFDGNGAYRCIQASDRAEVWRRPLARCQQGVTPAIDGGFLYGGGSKGDLVCLNVATGAVVWSVYQPGSHFFSAITVDDTRLYLMEWSGRVECHSRANGALLWSYQTQSYAHANLAIHNGTLFCTSDDRFVRGLDCVTGAVKWQIHHTGNFARSAPFVCGGMVFSSGCSGEFYGDDEGDGHSRWVLAHGSPNSFDDWAYADGWLVGQNRVGQVFCFYSHCPSCTATPTSTPDLRSPTPTASPTLTATPSATPTATGSATPTASPSPTATPSATPTASPTSTPSASPTWTPTAPPTATPTATRTTTPSATPTATPTASPTASPSLTVSSTPSATPSSTTSPTPQPTHASDDTGGLEDPGHRCYTYPNPSHGHDVWVVYHVDGPCQAKVRVFQSAGDPASKSEQHNDTAGVKRCQIPSGRFAPGVYFYKVDLDYDDGHHESRDLAKFICNRD